MRTYMRIDIRMHEKNKFMCAILSGSVIRTKKLKHELIFFITKYFLAVLLK
jgi:hypothetical protein